MIQISRSTVSPHFDLMKFCSLQNRAVHVNIEALLQTYGLRDTSENRAVAREVVLEVFEDILPGLPITVT